MIENTWIDVNVLMRIMMSLVTWRGSLVVKTEKLWATALRHEGILHCTLDRST